MIFDITLTIALIIFGIGLIHRIDTWFIMHVGVGDRNVPVVKRFKEGAKGVLTAIFSLKIFKLIKVLLVDILFQARILKDRQDSLVWVMHIFLFFGFMFLLLFHALGNQITASIDMNYQSTLNPYMFLRNLFGCFMGVGLVLAIIRRAVTMKSRIITNFGDIAVLVILILILCSGFLLEGLKITSQDIFNSMVEEYTISPEPEEIQALEAYWVDQYGVVSAKAPGPFTKDLLSDGAELNEASCIECHSRPRTAFISYAVSRLLKPAASGLDKTGAKTLVWYIHILASFAGLAYLAFGKMFHIIATPISLIVAEISGTTQNQADTSTRQMIEFAGCSHGGICHDECPVHIRRMERIGKILPYTPLMDFLDKKSAKELGSRQLSN
jgi:nitrate reductase gamma subunit